MSTVSALSSSIFHAIPRLATVPARGSTQPDTALGSRVSRGYSSARPRTCEAHLTGWHGPLDCRDPSGWMGSHGDVGCAGRTELRGCAAGRRRCGERPRLGARVLLRCRSFACSNIRRCLSWHLKHESNSSCIIKAVWSMNRHRGCRAARHGVSLVFCAFGLVLRQNAKVGFAIADRLT